MFEFTDAKRRGVVFAFRMTGAPEAPSVTLKGLEPQREYTVAYQDSGKEYQVSGAELMETGIVIDGLRRSSRLSEGISRPSEP